MFFAELLLALVLAALVAAVLASTRRSEDAGLAAVFVFFFLLLFPLIWAAGVWLTPVGPPLWGVPWLGFLLVSLFLLVLLLAAAVPSGPPRRAGGVTPENAGDEALRGTVVFFGLFFWVLVIGAAVAVITRYATV